MDKESMIQVAESEWLAEYAASDSLLRNFGLTADDMSWPWFWLILAESIWPESSES